ncbi:hypothetical protein SD81_019305 [Tolypothrix campylonemoides VB511288]|nr:hypothetical protein SD81_019305 [Tolypothrix campylonemoides VB511288]
MAAKKIVKCSYKNYLDIIGMVQTILITEDCEKNKMCVLSRESVVSKEGQEGLLKAEDKHKGTGEYKR